MGKACAEILLVSKQVSEAKMESYMAEFFPRTWAKFDSNNTGEIDITESHTFMRSLLGRLNQFVLAPGSLTDISERLISSTISINGVNSNDKMNRNAKNASL